MLTARSGSCRSWAQRRIVAVDTAPRARLSFGELVRCGTARHGRSCCHNKERFDVSTTVSHHAHGALGDEASVYDWARAQVHALNPTAARVWRQCDGATSPDAIAAALRVEMGIPEADAVVDLTLRQLARLHLLELPVESRGDRPATTRRGCSVVAWPRRCCRRSTRSWRRLPWKRSRRRRARRR